ncbi:MAG: ligase [Firmicutes bacterium]|nr:ligase [Bacillota bacterium]
MMPIYLAGPVDWLTSQALYHALPVMGEEGVVLCWPTSPYVCIGRHQDLADVDPAAGVPVVRRKVGGTLVYLDDRQIFYQVILRPAGRNRTPGGWYRQALEPVVGYLREQGLDAELREPADILVDGRKVSGNGGGYIGDMAVVVGNLLLDFPVDRMAEVRASPHPAFRSAFRDSMRRQLTTLRRYPAFAELSMQAVMEGLAGAYAAYLGGEVRPVPWERWRDPVAAVGRSLIDPDWLAQERLSGRMQQVKVREGVFVRALPLADGRMLIAEVDTAARRLLAVWGLNESLPVPLDLAAVEQLAARGGPYAALPDLLEASGSLSRAGR